MSLLLATLAGLALTKQPNIVVVLVDDLGWKDARTLGSRVFNTPNIDNFAAHSEQFTKSYASASVCSPSRAAIMTGQNPARIGITDWLPGAKIPNTKLLPAKMPQHLDPGMWTLPRALRNAGYATWHVGKWHLGAEPYGPTANGFDVNIGGSEAGQPYGYFFPYGNDVNNENRVRNLSGGKPGEYLTDRLTDEAINLIKNRDSRPFFLYLAQYTVHFPFQAKKEDLQKYEPLVSGNFTQDMAEYAGMVDNLDMNFGRLLKTLDQEGIDDNTVVIFTSDNGGLYEATDNLPLRKGKGFLYEGGIRVPLFVRWPGHTANGSQCDMPVESMDMYPSLIEIGGAKRNPRQPMDARSYVPQLENPSATAPPRALFWHYPHYHLADRPPCSAVRDGDWKLLHWYEDDRYELYDLASDPGEQTDMSASRPDLVAKLRKELEGFLASVHAKFPTKNPDYKPGLKVQPSIPDLVPGDCSCKLSVYRAGLNLH